MQEFVRRIGEPEADPSVMDANQAAIALATAMNEARAAAAERESGHQEACAAAVVRLEALRRRLAPLYAAIPRDVESFDLGLVGPERPRLFVDIIAYVEPCADGAAFRFIQESRSGRTTIIETADEPALIDEITRYIARRLVARERALSVSGGEAPPQPSKQPAPVLPLNAEDALRRWTRASPDARPNDPPAAPRDAAAGERPADRPERDTPIEAPEHRSAAAQEPVRQATSDRTPDAPPARLRLARPPPARPSPRSAGWWLWPIAALLIGLGLGALALYLYATTLVR
jgi:hypothetical protein